MTSCKTCKSLLPIEKIMLFCPFCGETVFNIDKEIEKEEKAIKKINLKEQIFLSMLLFFNSRTSYKIGKMKIIGIIDLISIVIAIAWFYGILYLSTLENQSNIFYLFKNILYYILPPFWMISYDYAIVLPIDVLYITWLINTPLTLILIIRWSIQWNKKIEFLLLFK